MPGPYQVNEATKAGWDLTQLNCTDPSGGTTTSLANRQADIALAAGETVHCTFTNRQRGKSRSKSRPTPTAPRDFTFTGTAAGTISDDGQIVVPGSDAGHLHLDRGRPERGRLRPQQHHLRRSDRQLERQRGDPHRDLQRRRR